MQIIDDPLQIKFSDSLSEIVSKHWPNIHYFNFDNYSGEEIFAYARQIAQLNEKIIIFMSSEITEVNSKITGWMNFIIRQKSCKILLWQGKNYTIDMMKAAFDRHFEINTVEEVVEQINIILEKQE